MSRVFDALKHIEAIQGDKDLADDVGRFRQQRPSLSSDLLPACLPGVLTDATERDFSASAPILSFADGQNAAAEQYRIIRTKILHHPKKPRVLAVSSACSGDGKTITSINIAASFSLQESSPVLLVDADLRRPRIAEVLGIPIAPGLSEVISGHCRLESALVRSKHFPNLYVLPAGDFGQNPAELLASEEWHSFVNRIRSQFRFVVFDTTPVATVADYELIQVVSDAVVIVLRPDHTDRKAAAKTLNTVPKEKLLGVVLNCVEDWWLWSTPAYGYYRDQRSSPRTLELK
jgi:capsular exopolysaccharide synthesis family protein